MAMLDYTHIKCPVCGDAFKEDDDIVVCPQCGAPYHRACYQEKGKCIFDDLHEAGKEWAPPAPPAPKVEPSAEIKDRECPACGTLNGHSALFCNRCGTSLLGAGQPDQKPPQAPPPFVSPAPPVSRNAYGGVVPPFSFDPMGGVSPAELLDEGVSFGDASKFVRQNTTYYMPVFRYIKQTGRNKFSFSAFLFSGAWLLYRKQYKTGALVAGLMFCLYLAYLLATVFVSAPLLAELAGQVGMDITQGFSPTNEQMLAISQLVANDLTMYLKISLPLLCLLAMLVVMIVVGVRGNKMYMRHCVRQVRQIKEQGARGSDVSLTLEAKGGVNISIAVCMFVCYVLLVNVVPLML